MQVSHTQGPVLETERLRLRVPEARDFDSYAEMAQDEEDMRHIGGTMARAAAWRRFLQMPGAWALQGFAMFAVETRQGEWLGQLGPWQPEGWPGTEVGWAFKRSSWGHGYATEAAIVAIDWAFDHLGWSEVIHSISPDNHASQALARRLGSVNRGRGQLPAPFDGEAVDIWAQSSEQWRARRQQPVGAAFGRDQA
jgi:RimJ/RimL family protein N-acetyltransferase